MNRIRLAFGLVLGLVVVSGIAGQEVSFTSEYFPLKVGHKWHYRVGEHPVVVEVERTETFKVKLKTPKGEEEVNVVAYRLKSTSGDNVLTESVGVMQDGIYRFAAAGKEIVPPLRLLPLPVAVNEKWSCDSLSEKMTLKGVFVSKAENVKVPAGEFLCRTSTCLDFQIGPQKMEIEYWFAEGKGIVKQRTKLGNSRSVVLELERFEDGK